MSIFGGASLVFRKKKLAIYWCPQREVIFAKFSPGPVLVSFFEKNKVGNLLVSAARSDFCQIFSSASLVFRKKKLATYWCPQREVIFAKLSPALVSFFEKQVGKLFLWK